MGWLPFWKGEQAKDAIVRLPSHDRGAIGHAQALSFFRWQKSAANDRRGRSQIEHDVVAGL